MRKLITLLLLMVSFGALYSQVGKDIEMIRTEGDYVIVLEKDNIRFEFWDEYVSYDANMNRLGAMKWHSNIRQVIGEKEHILTLYRYANDAGTARVTVFDKNFNVLEKKAYKKGTVEGIKATDNFFMVQRREKYWGPIFYEIYDWEFNQLGRLQTDRFVKEVYLMNNHIVIKRSVRNSLNCEIKSYDAQFNELGSRRCRHN